MSGLVDVVDEYAYDRDEDRATSVDVYIRDLVDEIVRLEKELLESRESRESAYHYVGHDMTGGPWPVSKESIPAVIALEEKIERMEAVVNAARDHAKTSQRDDPLVLALNALDNFNE